MMAVPGPIQYFSSDDDHPEVTENPKDGVSAESALNPEIFVFMDM